MGHLGVQCWVLAEARAMSGCAAVDTLCGGWIKHPLLSACEGLDCNLAHQQPERADQLLGCACGCFFATPLLHLKTIYCVFEYFRVCALQMSSRCQRNSFTIMMVPPQATSFRGIFPGQRSVHSPSKWRAFSPRQRCCCCSHASPPSPQTLPSCAAPPQRSPLLLRRYGATTSPPAARRMTRPGSVTTWTAPPIPWSVWLRGTSSCGATTQVSAALAPHATCACFFHALSGLVLLHAAECVCYFKRKQTRRWDVNPHAHAYLTSWRPDKRAVRSCRQILAHGQPFTLPVSSCLRWHRAAPHHPPHPC